MSSQGVFSEFSRPAFEVCRRALEKVHVLKSHRIGSPHILLALADEERGLVSEVFAYFDVTSDKVQRQIVASFGGPVNDSLVFLETAGHVRWRTGAVEESQVLGYSQVSVIHMLLALSRQTEGAASRVLASLGVSMEELHNKAMSVLSRSNYNVRNGFEDTVVPTKGGIDKALTDFGRARVLIAQQKRRYKQGYHQQCHLDPRSAPPVELYRKGLKEFEEAFSRIARQEERLQMIRWRYAEW